MVLLFSKICPSSYPGSSAFDVLVAVPLATARRSHDTGRMRYLQAVLAAWWRSPCWLSPRGMRIIHTEAQSPELPTNMPTKSSFPSASSLQFAFGVLWPRFCLAQTVHTQQATSKRTIDESLAGMVWTESFLSVPPLYDNRNQISLQFPQLH